MLLPEAIIYTDGSCSKDGDGGWAALIATPSFGLEIAGYESSTTNNRMEMLAAIKGMEALPGSYEVKLVSDSAYLLNTISNKWYEKWIADTSGYIRPNLDLWLEIKQLLCYHIVIPIKIKGHSGVTYNERVDKLAVSSRKDKFEYTKPLYGNHS